MTSNVSSSETVTAGGIRTEVEAKQAELRTPPNVRNSRTAEVASAGIGLVESDGCCSTVEERTLRFRRGDVVVNVTGGKMEIRRERGWGVRKKGLVWSRSDVCNLDIFVCFFVLTSLQSVYNTAHQCYPNLYGQVLHYFT